MTGVLSLKQVENLAERTLSAIGGLCSRGDECPAPRCKTSHADRERIASDLAGFKFALAEAERRGYHSGWTNWRYMAEVFENNLLRTARLYGVTP